MKIHKSTIKSMDIAEAMGTMMTIDFANIDSMVTPIARVIKVK
jgi:hypothetical protein